MICSALPSGVYSTLEITDGLWSFYLSFLTSGFAIHCLWYGSRLKNCSKSVSPVTDGLRALFSGHEHIRGRNDAEEMNVILGIILDLPN